MQLIQNHLWKSQQDDQNLYASPYILQWSWASGVGPVGSFACKQPIHQISFLIGISSFRFKKIKLKNMQSICLEHNVWTIKIVTGSRPLLSTHGSTNQNLGYRKVPSSRPVYYSILEPFGQIFVYLTLMFSFSEKATKL